MSLLCITLSSCDIITYYDCKSSMEEEGYDVGTAASKCKGNQLTYSPTKYVKTGSRLEDRDGK